ncbi:alpha/beta fold hydrolase [Pseudalkalibacillus sp. A8]|uniref:alpha/beta fold hydrolase n=1 Tax=Pseudalkalibacillus sp. A8 TaxID=3382641 RepID=UPI0038B60595
METVSFFQKRIRYEERGTGEPLILIHGVGLDYTMWQMQMEKLSDQFRVIAYDMIGHGGSEHPPAPYSLSQFVEQLAMLLDYLQIEKAHLVGFSMGGMVAQAFTLEYAHKVKTLTIMSAVANRTASQREAVLERVKEVKKNGPSATIEPAIQRWFSEDFMMKHKEIVENVRNRLKQNNPASYLASYTLFATADQLLFPKLHTIEVPTLIVTGEEDIGSNPKMAKQMGTEIASSQVVIVPGMKHMLPIEGAEIVNETIHSFIEKQSNVVR